jgi:hypothetical protein
MQDWHAGVICWHTCVIGKFWPCVCGVFKAVSSSPGQSGTQLPAPSQAPGQLLEAPPGVQDVVGPGNGVSSSQFPVVGLHITGLHVEVEHTTGVGLHVSETYSVVQQ